jgi:hypothetical protein
MFDCVCLQMSSEGNDSASSGATLEKDKLSSFFQIGEDGMIDTAPFVQYRKNVMKKKHATLSQFLATHPGKAAAQRVQAQGGVVWKWRGGRSAAHPYVALALARWCCPDLLAELDQMQCQNLVSETTENSPSTSNSTKRHTENASHEQIGSKKQKTPDGAVTRLHHHHNTSYANDTSSKTNNDLAKQASSTRQTEDVGKKQASLMQLLSDAAKRKEATAISQRAEALSKARNTIEAQIKDLNDRLDSITSQENEVKTQLAQKLQTIVSDLQSHINGALFF